MKNKINEVLFGRSVKLSALCALAVLLFVGLGCFGGRKTAGTIPSAYLGDWQGQDGTTLSIRADGTGDYHSGGTKIDGGTAEVNDAEKTLSITFVGIGKTLKIDQPPAGDQMKLDGMTFRRRGGFTDSSTSNSSVANSPTSSTANKSPFGDNDSSTTSAALPSNAEIETLIKASTADFGRGVDQGDFDDFRQNTSDAFQRQFTTAQVNAEFQKFSDQRNVYLPIVRQVDATSANFSGAPYLRTEQGYQILVANGSFPTSPKNVSFETEYVMEKGRWKLLTYRVRI